MSSSTRWAGDCVVNKLRALAGAMYEWLYLFIMLVLRLCTVVSVGNVSFMFFMTSLEFVCAIANLLM